MAHCTAWYKLSELKPPSKRTGESFCQTKLTRIPWKHHVSHRSCHCKHQNSDRNMPLMLWTYLLTPNFCPAKIQRQSRIPGGLLRVSLQTSSSPAVAETSARKQKPSETKKVSYQIQLITPSIRATQSVSRSSTIQSTPSPSKTRESVLWISCRPATYGISWEQRC